MASEKQIAANRANAMRSTGPKSLAGKLASSRNAYRHGLSGPLRLDPFTSTKVDAIAIALTGAEATKKQLKSAAEFARAQVELQRIRSMRTEMMEGIDLHSIDMRELRRISALDRYERYCLTRRRRSAREI
jgi:hypothetical protein